MNEGSLHVCFYFGKSRLVDEAIAIGREEEEEGQINHV